MMIFTTQYRSRSVVRGAIVLCVLFILQMAWEAESLASSESKRNDLLIVTTWHELNEKMAEQLSTRSRQEHADLATQIKATALFDSLGEDGNPVLWSEMLRQGDYPILQVTAFLIATNHGSEAGLDAAAVVIASTDSFARSIYAPILDYIRSLNETERVKLLHRIGDTGIAADSAAQLVLAMDPETLTIYVENESDETIIDAIPLYAYALDRLAARYRADGLDIPEERDKQIQQLKTVPGLSRSVYFGAIAALVSGDREILQRHLAEPRLGEDEFAILVRRWHKQLNLDGLRQELDADRKELLDEMVASDE